LVRIQPDPPFTGGVAQLGEHLLCKQGVIGSIPFTSTIEFNRRENPLVHVCVLTALIVRSAVVL
jgi:multisubunit Na+/H+ antiporter MnhC subunit